MPSTPDLITIVVVAAFWMVIGPAFQLWLQCRTTGVPLSFWNLFTMRRTRSQRRELVASAIASREAGSPVDPETLMTLQDDGIDVTEAVRAFIEAVQADPSARFDHFTRGRPAPAHESIHATESSE